MAKKKILDTIPPEPAPDPAPLPVPLAPLPVPLYPLPVPLYPPGSVRVSKVPGFDLGWWSRAGHAVAYPSVPPGVAGDFRALLKAGSMVVGRTEAQALYLWASTVDGWSDPDQPWSPHPIRYELLDK